MAENKILFPIITYNTSKLIFMYTIRILFFRNSIASKTEG